MGDVALRTDNLTKRYGATTAVDDVSFTALPGRPCKAERGSLPVRQAGGIGSPRSRRNDSLSQ